MIDARGLVELDYIADGHFVSREARRNHFGTMFGGQLVCQSLSAACSLVPDWPVTSLHAYFLVPVEAAEPVEYKAILLRSGRSFANVRIDAVQGGRMVFTQNCAFHDPERGMEHQSATMPSVPRPEDVQPVEQFVQEHANRLPAAALRNYSRDLPMEVRPIDPGAYFFARKPVPERSFWFRLPSASDISDLRLQQCLIAYCSDYWLSGACVVPHVFPTNSEKLLIASLDHAMWFHRPGRCDDWMLHHTEGPAAGDGIGFARGQIFDRNGQLVASCGQESLLRLSML